MILILFGRIPYAGTMLYALLFLPIYLLSLCFILGGVVGIWFYPPILARYGEGITGTLRRLYLFVREQNFTLVFAVPFLFVFTSACFIIVYLLHYGALSLTMSLSRSLLTEDLARIFAGMPFPLQRMVDFFMPGTDVKVLRSLWGDVFLSHQAGGIIIGLVLLGVSVLLFASLLSFTATLSARVYLLLDNREDLDRRRIIELLLVVVLLLAGLFFLKKFFF
jgi:hypothetical protein